MTTTTTTTTTMTMTTTTIETHKKFEGPKLARFALLRPIVSNGCLTLYDLTQLACVCRSIRSGLHGTCIGTSSNHYGRDMSWRILRQLLDSQFWRVVGVSMMRHSAYQHGHVALPTLHALDVLMLAKCDGLKALSIKCSFARGECTCSMVTGAILAGNLRGLRALALLECDHVLDTHVTTLGLCVNLQTLTLHNCEKISNIGPLRHCTMLQHLYVVRAQVADISALGYCTDLNTISLAFNCSLTDISALARCKSLRHLDLHGCTQVCNIYPLGQCANLQTLVLTSSKVSDVSVLGQIDSLEVLVITHSNALHDVSALKHCTRLKVLDLRHCTSLQQDSGVKQAIPLWGLEWAAMDVSRCENSTHLTWQENATPLWHRNILPPFFRMFPCSHGS
jgi:hypothetical protein